jgi:serine/threonine protein kinase
MPVVGQGTYGCVNNPSLKCKIPIDYTNKVSKILTLRNAAKELEEYKIIDKVDKHQRYYLGKPHYCDVLHDSENKANLAGCRITKHHSLDEFGLIIMKDGGVNLQEYIESFVGLQPTPEYIRCYELFAMEALRLFTGLKRFKAHGIIHHDLKPQNFVYHEETNRLNFIDFGFMGRKSDFLAKVDFRE